MAVSSKYSPVLSCLEVPAQPSVDRSRAVAKVAEQRLSRVMGISRMEIRAVNLRKPWMPSCAARGMASVRQRTSGVAWFMVQAALRSAKHNRLLAALPDDA